MFERIFRYHYSNKFAYALDALCIWIALEALQFLNGAALCYPHSIGQARIYRPSAFMHYLFSRL